VNGYEVLKGTQVEILIPPPKPTEEEKREWEKILAQTQASGPPEPLGTLTAEQQAIWQELKAYLQFTEPRFRTVEEAMSYTRKRP
jgi:hypothetical protein